jgi:hypothetical protein
MSFLGSAKARICTLNVIASAMTNYSVSSNLKAWVDQLRNGCDLPLHRHRSGRTREAWQITPRTLLDATTDPDRAAAGRAFEAMMKMKKIDIAAIEAARRGTTRA